MSVAALAERINALLPQTQCTRCGEPDCRRYAQAIAEGRAPINRCPPGGDEGVAALAALTGQNPLPLDPACGVPAERGVARIFEEWCIGCTLCIQACPVDAIVGAARQMHSVIEDACTGCELCIPVCPVDCIDLPSVTPGRVGWQAWDAALAAAARGRYERRLQRLACEAQAASTRPPAAAEPGPQGLDTGQDSEARTQDPEARKRAFVEAAIAKARARAGSGGQRP